MDEKKSYTISEISANIDIEINRLKAQVDLFWDEEIQRYKGYGLKDGMEVVELGSGPGFITERLLTTFPNLKVTGIEIDPLLVEYSRNYLSKNNLKKFNIKQGSIMKTNLKDNSYDFAIIRLVIEHLPNPVEAVKEVFRILKPGGKAIFIDNDFQMHIMTYPEIPELRLLYDAYCKARVKEGGYPTIGRVLPQILKQGGYSNIDFQSMTVHSEIVGYDKFLNSEGLGIPSKLVSDGFLESKVLAKIAVEWRKMINSEDKSIVRQLFIAAGEKIIKEE